MNFKGEGKMAKNIVAVNDDEINKLMLKITDYSGRLRRLFNDIQDLSDDSSLYSACTALNKWRSNIRQLKDDCDNVIKNLSSYKSDLARIKMLHYDEMVELSRKIQSKAVVRGTEHL